MMECAVTKKSPQFFIGKILGNEGEKKSINNLSLSGSLVRFSMRSFLRVCCTSKLAVNFSLSSYVTPSVIWVSFPMDHLACQTPKKCFFRKGDYTQGKTVEISNGF